MYKISWILYVLVCVAVQISATSFKSLRTSSYSRFSRSPPGSNFCPEHSYCVPLSSCPILRDMIKNDCVVNNRISSLGCGYQGSGLVCCPQQSESTSVNHDKVSDGQVCGQSAVQGHNYEGIGAFPFVVRVGFKNTVSGETKYPCAGSILNRRIILSAAHCALAKAENYKLYDVRVGEYSTNTDIDCGEEFCALPTQDIGISHVIVHPNYEKQTFRNNIALIVLRSPINYTVTAQPICLPESWSVTSSRGLLVGWGKAAGQLHPSHQQQVLHLPVIGLRTCVNVYGQSMPLTEENVCAGGELGNDACSGFGGAPLLVNHGERYYQIGILSFGSDQCGAQGVPSVYTNIKQYVTWIKENIPVIYN